MVGVELPRRVRAKGVELSRAMRRPLFHYLHQIEGDGEDTEDSAKTSRDDTMGDWKTLKVEDAGDAVALLFARKLARTQGLSAGEVDIGRSVTSYGVDSLVAVELGSWFRRGVGSEMSIFELLRERSILDLCKIAVNNSSTGEAKKS